MSRAAGDNASRPCADPARRYAAFCAENGVDADALHRRHAMSWEMLERHLRPSAARETTPTSATAARETAPASATTAR